MGSCPCILERALSLQDVAKVSVGLAGHVELGKDVADPLVGEGIGVEQLAHDTRKGSDEVQVDHGRREVIEEGVLRKSPSYMSSEISASPVNASALRHLRSQGIVRLHPISHNGVINFGNFVFEVNVTVGCTVLDGSLVFVQLQNERASPDQRLLEPH